MRFVSAAACFFFATAWAAPSSPDGYHTIFFDDFDGAQGKAASGANWIYKTGIGNSNKEIQKYTTDAANAHLSGDGQLYIIPKKSGNSWTSARLESQKAWSCPSKKAMIFQAEIWVPDFTGSPAKFKGLWPSFWAKGVSNRNGAGWPDCGEWDIFEVTNKMSNWNQGTLHFRDAKGNHNGAFSGRTSYTGGQYHTWAFKVDRRDGNWQTDKLIWYLDGKEFYRVAGANIGTLEQWKQLAWQPYFMIMQMAIGGDYADFPDGNTVDGYAASMRVKYAAVYESN